LDLIAVDREKGRVYMPEGTTGSLDVLDVATSSITRVSGFKTTEREARGTKRTMGPSAAAVGVGVVYVVNRGTDEVCVVDSTATKRGACLKLPSAPDGNAYVPAAKEVWVTTPHDHSLTILDATKPGALKAKQVVKLDGDTEGYAVDDKRGWFFTNLEDKGTTMVVDVKTHALQAKWNADCGADNARGLAVDVARGLLFVACVDHVQVLDVKHDGAKLGRLDTGAGVDNIDYLEEKGLLYAASGKDQRLTIAHVNDDGQLQIVGTAATGDRVRNPVADAQGNAYVVDPIGARVMAFPFGK
jgi:DNA-binding beta-propeller fold protein YncE